MANELFIGKTQNSCRIALLKDKRLYEYHLEKENNKFNVGDIYLGTIKKIVGNLNASFVDIGYQKDAFLHYSDLGAQFKFLKKITTLAIKGNHLSPDLNELDSTPSCIDKPEKSTDLLAKNQLILVQIVKEPIANKGPRLSAELSLAGRYVILIPYTNTVNLSKKITDSNERERLQRLIGAIRPKNFGLIVRTAAAGIGVAKLDRDLKELVEKWREGLKRLKKAVPGDKIIGEVNRTYSILRDMLNASFDNIVVDDEQVYKKIKQYIQNIAPEKAKIVRHYQGKVKLFEQFGIEKQLKLLFGQTVSIEGGGYLIIEHTEAMHVIDVNSGNKATIEEDHEEMALSVNLAAAQEIARQLRLRDMGGIIVIDFIDIKNMDNKRHLYQKMKEYMKEDRAKVSILPLSKFGVMQITRQRVRPETNIVTQEQCPSCGGKGKIDASIIISDQIKQKLELLLMHQNEKNFILFVHPYLYAYFTKGLFSRRFKWFLKYKQWIKLTEDSSMGVTDFKFFTKDGEEIDVS